MDKLFYLSMAGAINSQTSQATIASNMSNMEMPAFKADLEQFRAMPVFGDGFPSRVYALSERPGIDYTPGSIFKTGNSLDVAVDGEGWLVVQAPDGTEALTRRGDLRISLTGFLENGNGYLVYGNGGPITLPPAEDVLIGSDGTVSIRPLGAAENELAVLDRLRLVNPDIDNVNKSADGLFRLRSGLKPIVDASVRVVPESLETSNVNMIGAMSRMIETARLFELNIKAMSAAEENDEVATRILALN
jgi:flagellar basal-body rod protein FlgF